MHSPSGGPSGAKPGDTTQCFCKAERCTLKPSPATTQESTKHAIIVVASSAVLNVVTRRTWQRSLGWESQSSKWITAIPYSFKPKVQMKPNNDAGLFMRKATLSYGWFSLPSCSNQLFTPFLSLLCMLTLWTFQSRLKIHLFHQTCLDHFSQPEIMYFFLWIAVGIIMH